MQSCLHVPDRLYRSPRRVTNPSGVDMVAFSHFGLRSDLPFTYDVRTEGKGVGWKADRLRTVTREEGVQKFLIFADGICERPLGRREAGREQRSGFIGR